MKFSLLDTVCSLLLFPCLSVGVMAQLTDTHCSIGTVRGHDNEIPVRKNKPPSLDVWKSHSSLECNLTRISEARDRICGLVVRVPGC
jgi:hypothetical protein